MAGLEEADEDEVVRPASASVQLQTIQSLIKDTPLVAGQTWCDFRLFVFLSPCSFFPVCTAPAWCELSASRIIQLRSNEPLTSRKHAIAMVQVRDLQGVVAEVPAVGTRVHCDCAGPDRQQLHHRYAPIPLPPSLFRAHPC